MMERNRRQHLIELLRRIFRHGLIRRGPLSKCPRCSKNYSEKGSCYGSDKSHFLFGPWLGQEGKHSAQLAPSGISQRAVSLMLVKAFLCVEN